MLKLTEIWPTVWRAVSLSVALSLCGGSVLFGWQGADWEKDKLNLAAPETCWLYSSWSNPSKPDASSPNRTDRLLAEPEVQKFMEELRLRAGKIAPLMFASESAEKQKLAGDLSETILSSLFDKTGCMFIESVKIENPESPPDIAGVALLEVGDAAGEAVKSLIKLVANEDQAPVPVTLEGHSFYMFALGEQVEVYVGSVDEYMVAGVGRGAVEGAIQRMQGTTIPPWLQDLSAAHPLERRSSLGYVNLAAIRELALNMIGPDAREISSALGLDNIQSLETSAGYSVEGMLSRAMLKFDGRPRGLFALAGDQGIQTEELAHIPDDALFAVAISLDADKVMNFIQRLMLRFEPGMAEEMARGLAEFQRETGVDFQNEILGRIGPTWSLYNGASDGWLTGMVLTASVEEDRQLRETMDLLVAKITEMAQGDRYAPRFRRRQIGESEVVSMIIPGSFMPMEPSWCIANGQLSVGLFPQSLAPIAKPMSYPSLMDAAEVDRQRMGFSGDDKPGKLLALAYQDTQAQFELLYPYVQMFSSMSQSMMADVADMPREMEEMFEPIIGGLDFPPARTVHRHLLPTRTAIRQTSRGFEMETHQSIPATDGVFAAPLGVALLLPAVQQVRGAAARTQSTNNMRQIGLAILNYESAMGRFPASYTADEQGKPLFSWRVRILPYIEEQNLYDQFRFDEPWDSPHNLEVAQTMPAVFRSPQSKAPPGMTTYLGIGGAKGALMKPADRAQSGLRIAAIVDGMSNTIMCVEASDELAVEWTRPDTEIDPENFDMSGLFGSYPNGTNALFCDCSIRFLSSTLDPEILKQLMIIDDAGPPWGWDSDENDGLRPAKEAPRAIAPIPVDGQAEDRGR